MVAETPFDVYLPAKFNPIDADGAWRCLGEQAGNPVAFLIDENVVIISSHIPAGQDVADQGGKAGQTYTDERSGYTYSIGLVQGADAFLGPMPDKDGVNSLIRFQLGHTEINVKDDGTRNFEDLVSLAESLRPVRG